MLGKEEKQKKIYDNKCVLFYELLDLRVQHNQHDPTQTPHLNLVHYKQKKPIYRQPSKVDLGPTRLKVYLPLPLLLLDRKKFIGTNLLYTFDNSSSNPPNHYCLKQNHFSRIQVGGVYCSYITVETYPDTNSKEKKKMTVAGEFLFTVYQ